MYCYSADNLKVMGRYSIKELEKLSGIKAHTIRIWEKRYGLIDPQRTETNIRYYTDDDLRKIINVALLNHQGIKISKIANMSSKEVNEEIISLSEKTNHHTIHHDQLIKTVIEFDEEAFEVILHQIILQNGFENTVINVLYPFLNKIGILWQTGNIHPAQEHFISNLIRQKIIVAIDELPRTDPDGLRAVVFLPENELHEIGLLFYNYILKKNGYRTYYLGQTVPYKDLKAVCDAHKPEFLITAVVSTSKKSEMEAYLEKMANDFKNLTILASGAPLIDKSIKIPKNITVFTSIEELKEQI